MSTSKINKEMKNEEMYFHDMDFNFYGAFQNIEEERDDTMLDRDFLEEEVNMQKGNKKKMETVISGLVEKGCANRYELLTIKEILEE
ncbi:hypothetical protein ZWY2020_010827 [Hordeum vulgare]|nr:hypothetical protein ZWY2020_010827 [Hordeum vulgare]